MYRRIVLAVDPEGLAESVLPTVATLARRSGGRFSWSGLRKPTTRQSCGRRWRNMCGRQRTS